MPAARQVSVEEIGDCRDRNGAAAYPEGVLEPSCDRVTAMTIGTHQDPPMANQSGNEMTLLLGDRHDGRAVVYRGVG